MADRKTRPPLRPARERFMENTEFDSETGCWLWTGGVGSHGYGVFYVGNRRQQTAHTYALERKLGRPIAKGLEALHSCDVHRCVSWDHLSEGTHAENMADAKRKGRAARPSLLVTECPEGHEYTPENTLWKTRRWSTEIYRVRVCRECNRQQCKSYKLRKKAA